MVFEKPKDMKYTDLCIYIDKNAYSKDCNDELLYEYIWLLVDMLSRKRKYFLDKQVHEQFCFYASNYIYFRIKKPKLKNGKTQEDAMIKSILNYLKKSLGCLRIKYSKTITKQEQVDEIEESTLCSQDRVDFVVKQSLERANRVDFSLCLGDVCKTIKRFVDKTPYGKTAQGRNLYISCLMSMLNMTTLRASSREFLAKERKRVRVTDSMVNELYKREREDFVILYHLDDSLKDYVRVLTLMAYNIVKEDLSRILVV